MTESQLKETINNLIVNLFCCKSFEIFNSTIGILPLFLLESLKRSYMKIVNKDQEDPEVVLNKVYILIFKYVRIWSSIVFNYNHYSKINNGSYFSLSEDHFTNLLKTSNPHMYQLYVVGLSKISDNTLSLLIV